MRRRRLTLAVFWILSLLAAAHAGAWAESQDGPLITGADIAFKPHSTRDGLIFGTIQIRINGTWRPVVVVDGGPMKSGSRVQPLE